MVEKPTRLESSISVPHRLSDGDKHPDEIPLLSAAGDELGRHNGPTGSMPNLTTSPVPSSPSTPSSDITSELSAWVSSHSVSSSNQPTPTGKNLKYVMKFFRFIKISVKFQQKCKYRFLIVGSETGKESSEDGGWNVEHTYEEVRLPPPSEFRDLPPPEPFRDPPQSTNGSAEQTPTHGIVVQMAPHHQPSPPQPIDNLLYHMYETVRQELLAEGHHTRHFQQQLQQQQQPLSQQSQQLLQNTMLVLLLT